MRSFVTSILFVLVISGLTAAQSGSSETSAAGKNVTSLSDGGTYVLSETQISGELNKSLDVKKAEVGDQVILKTKENIKSNGETVVKKGSYLIGRVTDVQARGDGSSSSNVSILFESLKQGGMITPITATIVSVTQSRASIDDGFGNSASGSGSSSTRASSTSSGSGGGLLGGVGSTVGGVVNTTTQTVGGLTSTVGGAANTTGQTVGGATKGIQISQSSDASVNGSSTLTLNGGNLRLEKGTTFNLSVSESAGTTENSKPAPKQNGEPAAVGGKTKSNN